MKIIYRVGNISEVSNLDFNYLPSLIREKLIRTGFKLNILVIGKPNCGLKTLINSIFLNSIIKDRKNSYESVLVENNIRLVVNITIKREINSSIVKNIKNSYKKYLNTYLYKKYDERYDCTLLLMDDIYTQEEYGIIKKIGQITNLIPIFTKSDIFTEKEMTEKNALLTELFKKLNIKIYSRIFFTIASENIEEERRIRKYSWGTINVEEEGDLKSLRTFLIENIYFFHQKMELIYEKFKNESKDESENLNEILRKIRQEIEEIVK